MGLFTAIDLMYHSEFVFPNTSVEHVLRIFRGQGIKYMTVVENESSRIPVGFVARDRLFLLMASKYGFALYQNKHTSDVMEQNFLMIESSTDVRSMVEQSMLRDPEKLYDDLVIHNQYRYAGMVSIKNIITNQMENILHKNRHIDFQNEVIKEVNCQVERTESRYRLLFESGVNAVAVLDHDGVIIQANRLFSLVTGYAIGDTEKTTRLSDIVHTDDRPLLNQRIADLRRFPAVAFDQAVLSESSSWEFRFVTRSGQVRMAEGAIRYLPSTREFICSLNDITEKKVFQERLRQSDKLSALGHMLTGITHELNNQLTPILGYTDLLTRDQQGLDDKQLQRIRTVRKAAVNAHQIVSTLLRFSKPKPLLKKPVDLGRLIEDNMAILKYHEVFRQSEIVRQDMPMPPVCIDEGQIGQVILNLLTNALQAMEPFGGVLTVKTCVEDGVAKISIRDSGKGIAEADLPRIFDPFFTTKTAGKGTGLGLSICHAIIEAHGGTIVVHSKIKQGSEFTVELPFGTMEQDTEPGESPVELPKRGDHKPGAILVVEDDPGIRQMVRDCLIDHFQCIIHEAANGLEAVSKLKSRAYYDAIISDLRMPDFDGMALHKWIVQYRSDMSGHLIFVTGDTYDDRMHSFLEENALTYLYKPFSLDALIKAVTEKLVAREERLIPRVN